MALLRIHERDNVAVAIREIQPGERLSTPAGEVVALQAVDKGHKVAIRSIKQGENVIKYGFPIGHAVTDIAAGEWIHVHNLKTNLGDILEYNYQPEPVKPESMLWHEMFDGYRRSDGRVGVRNEIWIIPTVSCINKNVQIMARRAAMELAGTRNLDGVYEFTHPYGCSQLGKDHAATQRILADLVNHPNAGGVLVVGLGCENNNIAEFKKVLGDYDPERVKFLVAQEVEDEIETGIQLIKELAHYVCQFHREPCPVSELVVGLKCGGSDGFSGITANPLVGAFSDRLIKCGGSTVLTEVPEMFGAETLLMNRAVNKEVFEKTVRLINNFKQYFQSYDQPVYENPSPGNKKGGISTLEEKSLGCTQKGGRSQVVDILDYGDVVKQKGLNLLNGPGNDMVAAGNLAAAGCQIILFTTGRGTPLGTAVPTVKIATNSELFRHKSNWMDFDAGRLLAGKSMQEMTGELFDYVLQVTSGRLTKAEELGFREIAIFKNGVTL
ncbi:d-galactarate dehydratase / altronate hydrolase c terminus [Lucifera butyrica]|uniref:D-galactarate dehydratase / altronate hydrolase c terminus n=1 Tax=Lucifera butyrica TaxID=1351585 RepID=A0A498R551_9FIRM|nr:altronate dehydratase family protein [Lucifera butyrica]VBB05392.1 d-galactarate dehydratase / altronate hydrolase c terminus [Lucifera butyrica]